MRSTPAQRRMSDDDFATYCRHLQWKWAHYFLQGGRCAYCDVEMRAISLDHIVPLSRGGRDSFENTCASCARCNRLKGDMLPEEFWASVVLAGAALPFSHR